MKIKTQKIICIILMIFPLISTAVALFFMPEQIPAHYGINGQADRWGSKYETLILPLTVILFGLFMFWAAKFSSKDETSDKNNEKIVTITNLFCLVLFNIMNLYFLYTDFIQISTLSSVPIDIFSLIFTVFGIGFIIIGNIMPKAKMNSLIELRTPWNMKNEDTWRKSQRFGGITGIISGLIMSIGCIFFFKGIKALFFSLTLLSLMCIVDLIYSYVAAKKY